MNPDAPIYLIPGDRDPLPASMSYATGGSPFAPWILGAQQRGARLLNSPRLIGRDGPRALADDQCPCSVSIWIPCRTGLSGSI